MAFDCMNGETALEKYSLLTVANVGKCGMANILYAKILTLPKIRIRIPRVFQNHF